MDQEQMETIKDKFNDYMEKKGLDMEEREHLALDMFLEYREYNKDTDLYNDDLDDDDLDDDDLDDEAEELEDFEPEEKESKKDIVENKVETNDLPKDHKKGIKLALKKPKLKQKVKVKPKAPSRPDGI